MADLDLQRITSAAMAVADREGHQGFTMRAVADELGVTATALYRHVENKQALISLLVDAVATQQVLPDPTGDWREDLWRMAAMMREMTRSHPAVAELAPGHQIWSPSLLPITERWMNLWQQSGLPLDAALRAAVTTSLALFGITQGELLIGRIQLPKETALTWVPNARRAFGIERDADADFELVTRAMIDGVHGRLAAPLEQLADGHAC